MHEIFHLCKNEISKSEYKGNFTFGVVLTGGGSRLNNITDLAQEIFEMNIKIGITDSVNGSTKLLNNPRYSTSIGIIKYAIENKDTLQGSIDNNYKYSFIDTISNKIEKIKKLLNIK